MGPKKNQKKSKKSKNRPRVPTLSAFFLSRILQSQQHSVSLPRRQLTSLSATNCMSKVRIPINPMQVGRVGAYSMYVRRGEQVVRQRKNSSNYGPEASRSLAQQTRRVRWSNLVNFYKVNAAWMAKAYEGLKAGQTIYNKFMQLNMDKSAVALAKPFATAGASICDAFYISDGKLPPVTLGAVTGEGLTPTNISTGDIAQEAGLTIGELSAAIIGANNTYLEGDNIALIVFEQTYNAGDVPRCRPIYMEFTLNSESDDSLLTLPMFAHEYATITSKKLAMNSATEVGDYAGFVFIHTRKSSGLQVSPQQIKMADTTVLDMFSTQSALQTAIDSYGVDASVPLDPNFNSARVLSAYVNGQAVTGSLPSFPSYTGDVTLEISVDGWNDDSCYLMFGEVRYTPLAVDGNKRTYIITDNGSARIYINGVLYGGFSVSGVVFPEDLDGPLTSYQSNTDRSSVNADTLRNRLAVNEGCVNYPFIADDTWSWFMLTIYRPEDFVWNDDDFVFVNCSKVYLDYNTGWRLKVSVTDATKPAYVTYQGAIFWVFNYQ